MRYNFAEINRELAAVAEVWVPKLLPNGQRFGRDWRCGSVDGEPGNSLSVTLQGNKAGVWVDNSTGDTGSALNLLMAVLRCNIHGAVEAAKDIARLPIQEHQRRHIPDEVEQRKIDEKIIRYILNSSTSISYTLVERYLVKRGIAIRGALENRNLRFVENLKHVPTSTYLPAMVGIVRDVKGNITGLHRTYLDAATCQKATVDPNKMMVGACLRGAVRLTNARGNNRVVGVCEGIETGMAAIDLFPYVGLMFAALSAAGMTALEIPSGVKKVEIFADHGQAGETAAKKLLSHLSAQGIPAAIILPESDDDFNTDLLRQHEHGKRERI